jgi:hypothetical protein
MKQILREFWGSGLSYVLIWLWILVCIGLLGCVWSCVKWMWPREWDGLAEPLFFVVGFFVLLGGPMCSLQCWLESPDNPRSPLQR